jgi:arylsulfatase
LYGGLSVIVNIVPEIPGTLAAPCNSRYHGRVDAPNVLWICTDSQRFDTLGCYGNPWVTTPHADRLAREGILFTHCYAQNPLCTPSRGAFLTGRYPVTNRLRQNGQDIPEHERLVTKRLAEEGYLCGLSGKLHLSACDRRIERYGRDPSGWPRPTPERGNQVLDGIERRIDDGYADTEFFWDHAPSGTLPSSAYTRWLAQRGAAVDPQPAGDSRHVKTGMPSELHQAKFCADMAIDFMCAHRAQGYPWLFSVNIFDPHFILDPPSGYLDPYRERLDAIPLPNYRDGELDDKPPYQKQFSERGAYNRLEMTDRDHRLCRAAYWAMCDHIDVQLGRMMEALDDTGQRDNTIVIFTSDHGELLGDHGIYIKGPFLYDPAIRVPLIIRWPGHIPENRRADTLVELFDIAPTLLDAAGLTREPGMQARSLVPVIVGETDHHRDSVYCEYYNSNPNDPAQFCTMVRTTTHKLVVFHGQELGELYDLTVDPNETRNLWNADGAQGIRAELLKQLVDRMAETADPLPPRAGIY